MAVDRTYSNYAAVRQYRDRGMQKWNPFATAELASAHRNYREDLAKNPPQETMEKEEIIEWLDLAKSTKLAITLRVQGEKEIEEITGQILEWRSRECVLFRKEHYQEIYVDDILSVIHRPRKKEGVEHDE